MKYYFGVIISVLVVVISLMFVVLYKIYKLHVKSTEEYDIYEQQELLSTVSGSKDSSDLSNNSFDPNFLNNDLVSCNSIDLLDSGVQGKQEVDVTQIQPDVKVSKPFFVFFFFCGLALTLTIAMRHPLSDSLKPCSLMLKM